MNGNPVGWFELYVRDMARATGFYQRVFQVTLQRLNSPGIEMWAFAMDMAVSPVPPRMARCRGRSTNVGVNPRRLRGTASGAHPANGAFPSAYQINGYPGHWRPPPP